MRKLLLLIGLLATVATCRAQNVVITNAGWFSMDNLSALAITNDSTGDSDTSYTSEESDVAPVIAETITPDIQALAGALGNDPLRIFNYVHDHIRHVLYFGSKKGAELTLLEKSGNDFDQCALLVALLRAAGHSEAGYQFGWMLMPYDNPDGSDRDLHHWLGLSLTNNNWSNTSAYLYDLFYALRNYPNYGSNTNYPINPYGFGTNTVALQRVWVTVTVGGTNCNLDPAFKVTEPISGLSLPSVMGFDSNALMTAAAGSSVGNFTANFYVTNVNEGAVRGTLAGYTSNLLSYIQSNCPNASVEQVLSGQRIVPSTNTTLGPNLLFPTTNLNGYMPIISWVNEPTNLMSTLEISFLSVNYQFFFPQLQGCRLSLTTDSTGAANLWLDDTSLASGGTGGGSGTFNVTLSAYHPYGGWDTFNNVFVPGTVGQSIGKPYANANATYALTYAFEPDWGWLQQRQKQLDAYRQQGLSNTSRQVVSETLNIMALDWQMQVERVNQILAQQIGVLPMFYHRLGRMSQEEGFGYYVDVYMAITGTASSSSNNDDHLSRWLDQVGYFGSAMEHGLIEQLQATNLLGASTMKILELANTNQQAVYMVDSTNWTTIESLLTNYSTGSLSSIGSIASEGYTILLPQNGLTTLGGAGSWSGYGLLARSSSGVQMLIGDSGGTHYGGYVSDLSATVNPSFVNYSSDSQPLYFNAAPASVAQITAADPVNMIDGTFQVQATDLSLGGTEPRGLNLTRYYSSARRNSNLAGMAPGWLHNYYCNAATLSAPQAALGGATPAQMASMLVATCAANGLYNYVQPDPKNWMVTVLIAKWGIDQLNNTGVSVNLGNSTVQFIKQPTGLYTPPANCTMSLLQTNGTYWLQERHGRTFKFASSSFLTNIIDQYGQSLNFTYNSSNWVSTVIDWKSRSLTFTYSGSNLTSVADSSGRSVSYGYAGGDLTSFTDPESKTSSYSYDTNNQIVATFDALSQLVVSNIYDGFGRITTQLTQGNTNKTWQVSASGYSTVETDPAGSLRVFTYDNKSRLISYQDALGNITQTAYDGQDHVVQTISPLNETNLLIYDGSNNVIEIIDPLGFSNSFVYDSQNNFITSTDARGHSSHFGYNAQFSLIGHTNGNGDWAISAYNTDGTLASRQDAGSTNTYSYDSYGQVNSISYAPDYSKSDPIESFLNNNSIGDPTNYTDANGFLTTFSYNKRRQLTNAVGPSSLSIKIIYDSIGNTSMTTDARGFSASNTWSVTRHLLATILPATPQGTPIITNTYDSRDWLLSTQSPLNKITYYTNDAAHRLVAITDPLQRTTSLSYDNDSRPTNSTDAASEQTAQTWNSRGNLVRVVDAATNIVGKAYDGANNLIFLTNRNGKVWQFQYDGANRLTNTISPLGHSSSQVYNNRGLLQSTTDPLSQTTSFTYNSRGRVRNITDNLGTIAYDYDGNNNVTFLFFVDSGSGLSWGYDAYNRATSFTNGDGYVIQYRYDNNGNLTNLIYPGNRTVNYYYDSNNRLTNVIDWASRQTSYAYDLAGHMTSLVRPNNTLRAMAYDSDGELTNIVEKATSQFPIGFFTLNYNAAGRVQWEFKGPLPHAYAPPTRTMTFDNDNRLLTFNSTNVTIDADGNLTHGPLTNGIFSNYFYNARNQLTIAGEKNYGYDPAGYRTSMTNGSTNTTFIINPQGCQTLMRITGTKTNYYIYGAGLLYESDETATTTNMAFYHFDARGSTVALTDTNGNPTDIVEYSPYGTTTYRYGTNNTPFLYNGQFGVQTDPNGLLYMRARYYNPYISRFINADPSGFGGGLNFYAFADGNPINELDPFGLGAVGENTSQDSWLDQAKQDWGIDSSPAAEQQATVAAANVLNFATLGLANPISGALTGQDLTGSAVDRNDAVEQLYQVGAVDASLVLAVATAGFAAEAEGAVGGFAGGAAPEGAPTIGQIIGDAHPDSMIHITTASEAQLATGLNQGSSFVRLGDVSHMTVAEYQAQVVGINVAGSTPNVTAFVVSNPGSGQFVPAYERGEAGVSEHLSIGNLIPDRYVPLP